MIIPEYDQCDCGKRGLNTECIKSEELTEHNQLTTRQEIIKEIQFRSNPMINMTSNMVKVELIISRNNWYSIKKELQNLGVYNYAKKE